MSRSKRALARGADVRRRLARLTPPPRPVDQAEAEVIQSIRDAPDDETRAAIVRWVAASLGAPARIRAEYECRAPIRR